VRSDLGSGTRISMLESPWAHRTLTSLRAVERFGPVFRLRTEGPDLVELPAVTPGVLAQSGKRPSTPSPKHEWQLGADFEPWNRARRFNSYPYAIFYSWRQVAT
jgi:hypothetical protein